MCWMRDAAEPPRLNASAAATAAATCQRVAEQQDDAATADIEQTRTSSNRTAAARAWTEQRDNQMQRRKDQRLAGSAICGQPAKIFGVQNGDCPASKRAGQKRELRIELRNRVPRHLDGADSQGDATARNAAV